MIVNIEILLTAAKSCPEIYHPLHYASVNKVDLVKFWTDMDPEQNTVEDLMLRICHLENVGNIRGVCLYTDDGMPLTDDPFFNTCE